MVWTGSTTTTTYSYNASSTNTAVVHPSWWQGPPDMGVPAWVIVPEPDDDDDRHGSERAA